MQEMKKVKFIDVHTHPFIKPYPGSITIRYQVGLWKYVQHLEKTPEEILDSYPTEEEWIENYRKIGAKALPISFAYGDLELQTTEDMDVARSHVRKANDYIASLMKKYPDVVVGGWGSINPKKTRLALEETERCVKELGLQGLKFHPAMQSMYPNDKLYYPIWDLCQDLGAKVMLHMGYTGVGGMQEGGAGILPLEYTNPIYLDEVARDFPKLTIIGAHPAWPYEQIAIAIWLHKPNFYRELSGWLPKYFDPELKREFNTRLQDKVMTGTEGPAGSFAQAFYKIIEGHATDPDYRPGIREKIMYQNAERILGIKVYEG